MGGNVKIDNNVDGRDIKPSKSRVNDLCRRGLKNIPASNVGGYEDAASSAFEFP